MKNCIVIILLGICLQLNSQSIIEDIELSLIRDSITFGEIELGFETKNIVKSGDNNYYVFNIKAQQEVNKHVYQPQKYFIFNRETKSIFKLETKNNLERYIFEFAKFYDSKLVLIYKDIGISNYYIDEFDLNGKNYNSRTGTCPSLQKCKCYDSRSDYLIWIEKRNKSNMKLLNLKTNKTIDLAQLSIRLSASGDYHGSPKIELDHLSRRVLVKDFYNTNKPISVSVSDIATMKKCSIKPIAEYEIKDDILFFNF